MSPHVGNFVQDLVEMAKATEQLPVIQAELDAAKRDNDSLHATVQSREEAIVRYKAEIEELQSKVRNAEVARDDAELRFLELDEKASKVLAHVASIQAAAAVVQESLTPKPEPVPEVKPEPVYTASGWRDDISPMQEGQSVSDPTSHSMASGGDNTEHPPQVDDPSLPSGPYSGKRYYDHPTYLTLSEWLSGGGTEADYLWSPERNSAF